jgi:hypothetical protein
VPLETALLTALECIDVNDNGISAHLSAVVPTELLQVPDFMGLFLDYVSFAGSIRMVSSLGLCLQRWTQEV